MRTPHRAFQFVLILIGTLLTASLSCAAESVTPNANLLDEINRQIAQLEIKPRTEETYLEKGIRIRKLINQGDFSTAHQIVSEALANSKIQAWRFYPFSFTIAGLPTVNDKELKEKLGEWIEHATDDPIPLLLRSSLYTDIAWAKRGKKVAVKTSAKKFRGFAYYMKKALDDIDASIVLDPKNPYAYEIKLEILSDQGFSVELAKAFTNAIEKFPNYFELYTPVLNALEPKWGGTVAGMYKFVDSYAGGAAETSPLKALYLSLYANLLDDAMISCGPNDNQDEVARCITTYMDENVTPQLRKHVQEALQLYDQFDPVEFGLMVEVPLKKMLGAFGGAASARPVFEQAATAMHSDTGSQYDRPPAHRHYIIDRLLAEIRRGDGAIDLGIAELKQALKDIETISFATEIDKNQELSRIYDTLASYYSLKQDSTNMIVYETAASKLNRALEHKHLACEGYYRLKMFEEALRSCTEVIDYTGNLDALFYRGSTYRQLQQWDKAAPDLTAVADSNNDQRIYAATGLVMIKAFQNDFKGQLSVYEKYPFLFDPQESNNAFVATTYYGRCFAYKNVDEIQRALDDCTEALKYAWFPPAYQQQQELQKRLGKK